jgi:hypothetical protein
MARTMGTPAPHQDSSEAMRTPAATEERLPLVEHDGEGRSAASASWGFTATRPGLVRAGADGGSIELELWSLPLQRFGDFVAAIPTPFGIGKVKLADGEWVRGCLCEAQGMVGAEDITALGGGAGIWLDKLLASRLRRGGRQPLDDAAMIELSDAVHHDVRLVGITLEILGASAA